MPPERLGKAEAAEAITHDLAQRVTEALRTLLGSKHLYQAIRVDTADYPPSDIVGLAPREVHFELRQKAHQMLANPWFPRDPVVGPSGPIRRPTLQFTAPDVKLFCRTCEHLEPFNLVSSADFITRSHEDQFGPPSSTIQVFVLSYLCQACKSVPEVLVIRRDGLKLTQSGRSPMEHIPIPSVIPKAIREYFSGALLAHQSGQSLAANFMRIG